MCNEAFLVGDHGVNDGGVAGEWVCRNLEEIETALGEQNPGRAFRLARSARRSLEGSE